MLTTGKMKKLTKRMLSFVLVLTVMFTLAVPLNITVFAEDETPQQASDKICAVLYKISGTANDYELVFRNSSDTDSTRQVIAVYDNSFASTEYHYKQYHIDSNNNPTWSWSNQKAGKIDAQGNVEYLPWYTASNNGSRIKKITFEEEIKPLSIASWFYNFVNVNEIKGLDKLNLSNCENMSYAFYNFANNSSSLDSLDLKCLNQGSSSTSNVRQSDFFFRSTNIKTLDLTGMDLSGIGRVHNDVQVSSGSTTLTDKYISDIGYFIYQCSKLTKLVFDGVDLSHIRQIRSLVYECQGLTELDLSKLASGPVDAYSVEYLFYRLSALKTVKLGSEEHLFEVGTNLTENEIWYAANSGLPAEEIESKSTRKITLIYLGNMFATDSALESMDFSYFRITDKVNLQCNAVFDGCSSLQSISGIENLFEGKKFSNSAWVFKKLFRGCSSLVSLDLSGNNITLGEGELIFANCSSLKTLDLSGLGLNLPSWTQANDPNSSYRKLCSASVSSDDAAAGYTTNNIYQGCEELTEVVFSPFYPTSVGSNNNIPPDKNWVKIEDPTAAQKDAYLLAGYSGNYSYAGDTTVTKTSAELFGDFKPEYAGRWVGISRIVLDANGGTPDKQFIENSAKGLPVNYDSDDITTPRRTGYTFVGWYSDKNKALDDPENQKLPEPDAENAEAWTYYARWNENIYRLTLDCNGGGTVPASVTPQSLAERTGIDESNIIISGDRKNIYFNNIRYTQYVELNKSYFESGSGDTILTSWGDRPNGTGREIGVNESVNKLTPNANGTVTLYAQWHTPNAIITFDVNDGGDTVHPASLVSSIYFDEADSEFGELPESSREGYDFMYWYYTTEDPDTHEITEHRVYPDTPVEISRTLYAKWMPNPVITFSCTENGGVFVDNSQRQTAVCHYNRSIGMLPTPYNGKAAFKGWFDNAAGTGDPITSDTVVTGNKIYYAVWGYKLEVDADGGSFNDGFAGYPVQDEKNFTVVLHTPEKPNAVFKGWYTDTDFADEHKVTDRQTLDLSVTNKIYAKFENDICTVTLDPNGGTVSKNSIKVYNGHSIGELPAPSRDGYDFLGWYGDVSGAETKFTYASAVTGDIELKAKWVAKNTKVTFKGQGGTFYETESENDVVVYVRENGTIDVPPGISKTGYYFDGWYTEPDGEGTKLETDTQIAAETTYYANWFNGVLTNADGTIQYFVKWNTPSDTNVTNNGDTLILHPTSTNNLNASLRVYFATKNGLSTIPAGGIEITVPGTKGVFKNRNGGSLSATTNYNSFQSEYFNKKISGNNYVFTSKKDFVSDEPTSTYIDIDYSLSSYQAAGGYIDENGDYQRLNDYNLNDCPVTIKINGETLHVEPLKIEVHTNVDTQEIQKSRSNVIYEWQDEWDEQGLVTKPIDLQNYFFIKWNLNSYVTSTSSQAYRIIWSEDTAHDGTVVYTSGPVVTDNGKVQQNSSPWGNEQNSGSSPEAYVVTMHRKDEARMNGNWAAVKNEVILNVAWRTSNNQNSTPYIQQYRTSVETTAYIAPDEGEGVRDFTKRVNNYKNESSHYINGGQELVQSGDFDELNKKLVYNYSFSENEPFDESKLTWNSETKVYTAPERTLTLVDGEAGKKDVRISPKTSGSGWNKWDAPGEEALTDTEYSFDALVFNITEYDVIRLDDDTWSNPFEHTKRSEYGYTDIYVRYEGDSDFSFYRTVQITAKDTEVPLPDKAVGFKIVHKTSFASTGLTVTTKLKLKGVDKLTETVVDDIINERETVIKNKARFTESMAGVEPFTVDTEHYVNAPQRDAFESSYILTVSDSFIYAKKSMASGSKIEVDDESGIVTVPTVITGWGYNNSGYRKRLKKCVFRDLLPVGFTVDKNSVFVVPVTEDCTLENYGNPNSLISENYFTSSEGDNENVKYTVSGNKYDENYAIAHKYGLLFSTSHYSVTFENNINNTGRTMMVVTVTVPDDFTATGVSVYYKMDTTLSSIAANTVVPINYFSFKDLTESQSVPVDKSGKINVIDSKLIDCYKGYEDEFTAYGSANTTLEKPPISTTAISSAVSADGLTHSKHEHVGLNSPYSYYIYYSNDINTQMGSIVFYDLLEKRFGDYVSEWEGRLKSIDVSAISQIKNAENANATCKPVIYYAVSSVEGGSAQTPITKENFTEDYFTLDNQIWSSTPPDDLSKVTAIAVDCSKDTNGDPFILDKGQYMGFNINMLSPTDGENNSMTYNDATIKGDYHNIPGASSLNMVTANDVTLHYPNPRFVKTAVPASGTIEMPNRVIMGSTLEYYITVTNQDEIIPMYNVVIEDQLDGLKVDLKHNNIMVKIGDEEEIPINDCPLISLVDWSDEVVTDDSTDPPTISAKTTTFTATIASVDPGQAVTVILPVTVKAPEGIRITNAARIKSVNDVELNQPFDTDPTYHVASSVVAKIKKVNQNGDALEGAKLQILDSGDNPITLIEDLTEGKVTLSDDFFMSGSATKFFEVVPGKQYKLVELAPPNAEDYKVADPIVFTVDSEGFARIGEKIVEEIEMVDRNAYNIIFHENKPEGTAEEIAREFRAFGPADIKNNEYKITEFNDIPSCGGSDYEFVGWYYTTGYEESAAPNIDNMTEIDFANDTYPKVLDGDGNPVDYHIYAMWREAGNTYNVIFHENKPGGTADEKAKVFKTFGSAYLNDNEYKIDCFSDTPDCGGVDYVFAGWYYKTDFAETADFDAEATTAEVDFSTQTYPQRDNDYHLYAKWEPVTYTYSVIFHENKPHGSAEDKARVFRSYASAAIEDNSYKINHFYDIPAWAGDEYVFAGWYYKNGFAESADFDSEANVTAVSFENQAYTPRSGDYHLYAKWIEVGTVSKAGSDTNNYGSTPIRGFGLAGVQIRQKDMTDPNFDNNVTPEGLRFVSSFSEGLYNSINALSSTDVDGKYPVEYGYAVGTKNNIDVFLSDKMYNITDPSTYKLQYKGTNVNGVNTTGETRTVNTDYRYITNKNCTSTHGTPNGVVKDDHRNFNQYRLFSLVVTYPGSASDENKGKKLDARAYIRYYDANGKLRVFYNDYDASKVDYYGGCMCSFNDVQTMGLPSGS